MGRVEGKVAIVTGAAMGLGAAQAQLFAEEGATVVATDIAVEQGRAVVEGLARPGLFLEHDVSSEAAWDAVEAEVMRRYGRLDILVNNAAILLPGSIEELSFAHWKKLQAVNADSAFLGCRAAVRMMKASGGGSIVNIASVAGLRSSGVIPAYGASKAALIRLTEELAWQLGPKIRVNAVAPAVVKTKFATALYSSGEEKTAEPYPMKRLGEPEDIASVVGFLVSDKAGWMTGETVRVDGGILATGTLGSA
jgi:NAD(P)-dependent dehydrogenase (short-subunit alcohol dehydrogenase family)